MNDMLDVFTLSWKLTVKSKVIFSKEVWAKDFVEAFNMHKDIILRDEFVALTWERSRQPRLKGVPIG